MKETAYGKFSKRLHETNSGTARPNSCQFELTYGCPLRCRHCYSDCYNTPALRRKELLTRQVTAILDKVFDAGVIWLCLTGGDPLARPDFGDIYLYARRKGFLVTVFTSGGLVPGKTAALLAAYPPFSVEITLNAVEPGRFGRITGRKELFPAVVAGIDALAARGVALTLKTMVTRQNLNHLDAIARFARTRGLGLKYSDVLYPRLNGDRSPCRLRLSPRASRRVAEGFGKKTIGAALAAPAAAVPEFGDRLYTCAAGADSFVIDPYGSMCACATVRSPSVKLLRSSVGRGLEKLKSIGREKFSVRGGCAVCRIRHLCHRCPGRALLETGDKESPVPYFCRRARFEYAKDVAHEKKEGYRQFRI